MLVRQNAISTCAKTHSAQKPLLIPFLNGVRGCSALMVMLVHQGGKFISHPFIESSRTSCVAVFTFFVLSGFLLTAKYLMDRQELNASYRLSSKGSIWVLLACYWIRRVFRIYPVFILAITVRYTLLNGYWDDFVPNFANNSIHFYQHFGLHAPGLYWTIAREVGYYGLIPLFGELYIYMRKVNASLIMGRINVPIGRIGLIAAITWWLWHAANVVYFPLADKHLYFLPFMWFIWCGSLIGCVLVELRWMGVVNGNFVLRNWVAREKSSFDRFRQLQLIAAELVVFGGLLVLFFSDGYVCEQFFGKRLMISIWSKVFYAPIIALLLGIGCLFGGDMGETNRLSIIRLLFESELIKLIRSISFPLYCFHTMARIVVLTDTKMTAWCGLVLWYFSAFVTATVVHVIIEKPAIKIGELLINKVRSGGTKKDPPTGTYPTGQHSILIEQNKQHDINEEKELFIQIQDTAEKTN